MASPADSARPTTSVSSAATTWNINVGSPAVGNLLIVLARFGGAPGTVTFTGYTSLNGSTGDATDASDDSTFVFYRWADGAEGATDTLTCTNSVKGAAICWVITGAVDPATQAPEISTVAIGTTTANTANPNAVTPTGGSKDYLFLALGAQDGEVGAYTGAPTNYANLVAANSGTAGLPATNVQLGGASRQLTAASDDPGAFTHAAAAAGWTAYTVAVHPALPQTYTKAGFGKESG
jgi:hypothetical protein